MRRRTFTARMGTVTICVAGGRVWRAFAQEEREIPDGPAFEPWRTWKADSSEGLLSLVHAAILSSNAFNSQPWLFKVSDARIEIYADTKRNLGAFDPYLREMFFSIGCALENLLLAASNRYKTVVSLIPGALAPPYSEPKPELAARVDLSSHPGGARSELFRAIPHRHTNRSLFHAHRELPDDFLRDLASAASSEETDVKLFLFKDQNDRKAAVDTIWDASRRFMANPDVRRGTEPWYRTTIDQLQNLRDGAYVGKPEAVSYLDLMLSGRLFGLIAVRDRYDRAQTIRAGRIWQRSHLLATARAVAARPANGAVEVIDHERRLNLEPRTSARLAALTGDASWQPTFMFYMGYPTVAAAASARRRAEDVLI